MPHKLKAQGYKDIAENNNLYIAANNFNYGQGSTALLS